jgi:hypothetical protein
VSVFGIKILLAWLVCVSFFKSCIAWCGCFSRPPPSFDRAGSVDALPAEFALNARPVFSRRDCVAWPGLLLMLVLSFLGETQVWHGQACSLRSFCANMVQLPVEADSCIQNHNRQRALRGCSCSLVADVGTTFNHQGLLCSAGLFSSIFGEQRFDNVCESSRTPNFFEQFNVQF